MTDTHADLAARLARLEVFHREELNRRDRINLERSAILQELAHGRTTEDKVRQRIAALESALMSATVAHG